MSGLKSRRKGLSGEYLVRDFFRGLGFKADRVPSSGAAQGFKGDVVIEKGDLKLKVEVKSRKDEYKSLYTLLDQSGGKISIDCANSCLVMSYLFVDLNYEKNDPMQFTKTLLTQSIKKLIGMRKLVKDADFLVVKINNKPLIFIRYF